MDYNQINIDIDAKNIEQLTTLLISFDIYGFQIIDDILDPDIPESEYEELRPVIKDMQGKARVVIYMEEGPGFLEEYQNLQNLIKDSVKEAEFSLEISREEDWRDKWKEYFHSFYVRDVLIKPSWEERHIKEGESVIEIDPGISFGTGTHETTKMCMEALADCDLKGKNVLDIGCGSGILSIFAHRKGAGHITCIDIDENCINTTLENLAKNQCDLEDFSFYRGDIITEEFIRDELMDGSFDVVVANILADIIIDMLPIIKAKLKPEGVLISSGIIEGKEEKVQKALLEKGFILDNKRQDGEWFMLKSRA